MLWYIMLGVVEVPSPFRTRRWPLIIPLTNFPLGFEFHFLLSIRKYFQDMKGFTVSVWLFLTQDMEGGQDEAAMGSGSFRVSDLTSIFEAVCHLASMNGRGTSRSVYICYIFIRLYQLVFENQLEQMVIAIKPKNCRQRVKFAAVFTCLYFPSAT